MPLPPGYHLERTDPEVLILRSEEGEVIARFSAQGHSAESVEREAWKHHNQQSLGYPPK